VSEDPNSAFYLYGFTQAGLPAEALGAAPFEASGLPTESASIATLAGVGIGGVDPSFWCHAGLAAIVSRVARDEFCGPVAESNLQDLAWVSPRALRHQAVLERVMAVAPILPARFGTLFSSLDAISQLMQRQRESIADFLSRTACHEEWAVKGLLDRAQAEAGLWSQKQAGKERPQISAPGLAYLLEQQARRKAKEELEEVLAVACSTLLDELTTLASEACSRPVRSPETTGGELQMISNWAFLVPRLAAAPFQEQVEQANVKQSLPGLTFAVSGPWPPYSFCPALSLE